MELRGLAAMTLKLEVVQNHVRSQWVSCSNGRGDSDYSSTPCVTGGAVIRVSNLFEMTGVCYQ